MHLKKDHKKSSGFSSSLSPWNGVTCLLDIPFSSCVGFGRVGALDDGLIEELEGVILNRVRGQLSDARSKPDKLE